MKCERWSKEEDEKLILNYQLKKNELLKLFPNRTSQAINIRASMLGLRKIQNEYCESNMSVLLEDNELAYYWIGFILADGCFSGVGSNRLVVNLSNVDKDHLIKMGNFLKTKIVEVNKKEQSKISCQDKFYSPKIREKFDIKRAKTYDPPSFIPNVDKNLLMAMFCGIVDGDGCIKKQTGRNDHSIKVKLHGSWEKYFIELDNILFNGVNAKRVQNNGYFRYTICKVDIKKEIYNFAINSNLPLLDRKWTPFFEEMKDRENGKYKWKRD